MGDLACVQVLLAAGASMMVRTVDLDMASNISCPAGSTPLHLAAQRGHISILQAMLQVAPPHLAPSAGLRLLMRGICVRSGVLMAAITDADIMECSLSGMRVVSGWMHMLFLES
jgi:ankyrin repeat protein